eukprot:12420419-Karenia_brevis.AAC.1
MDAGLLRLCKTPGGAPWGLTCPQKARIHFGCGPLEAFNGPNTPIWRPYVSSKGPHPFWMRAS